MVQIRILHVYAHLMFRALECGIGDEFQRLGLDNSKYYANSMVWNIICIHLCFYELDLIG
jgi:hypothetical protein